MISSNSSVGKGRVFFRYLVRFIERIHKRDFKLAIKLIKSYRGSRGIAETISFISFLACGLDLFLLSAFRGMGSNRMEGNVLRGWELEKFTVSTKVNFGTTVTLKKAITLI